jgi:glycosyltransferase involved in cell wall biosynthesis
VSFKKKILFIITHLELGGAQKELLYLIEGLDKKKYQIYLYAGNRGYLKEDFLKLKEINIYLDNFLIREINPLYDLLSFLKLFFFIKRHKFDIVHTHSPKASILGRWAAFFTGIKNIVYTVHGWPFHKFMNILVYIFFLYLEKLTAKITKKIIVVSTADLKTALTKKIAPRSKLVLIHYGVDIEVLNNIYLKRKETISRHLIINISSLKPQKGIFDFLKVVNLIIKTRKNLQFFIVGSGPLKNQIAKFILRHKLQKYVGLKGWIRNVYSLLSQASVLVLTSLWEGLPLVVLESVIAGIPVVVTDTGGIWDIVRNYENGIVCFPKDVKKISEAVVDLLDRYEEWKKKIKKFRKQLDLKYWSKERMIKKIDALYETLE